VLDELFRWAGLAVLNEVFQWLAILLAVLVSWLSAGRLFECQRQIALRRYW
jgi:hypothetical protein